MPTRVKFSAELTNFIPSQFECPITDDETSLLDYEVRIDDQAFHHWRERVPVLNLEPHEVSNPTLVIDTVDTIRHVEVVGTWMEQRKPFILCGPPGSGKTMSLMTVLKRLPECGLASLNFSSGTDANTMIMTLELYCETVKQHGGLVMRPKQPEKWIMAFCDECNLPEEDKYGTQQVTMWMRQ